MTQSARIALDRAHRREYGQILATLLGRLGDFELAEDAVQDAFLSALEHWEREGVPHKPGAWLTTAARRKAVDRIRRFNPEGVDPAVLESLEAAAASREGRMSGGPGPGDGATTASVDETAADEYPDERLKLMFICCHPALPPEQQVALTLHALGGLSTAEIAAAFLVPVPTLAQRLVRAKAKIKTAGIPYYVPPPHLWAERIESVLAVLYLIFTEGYAATAGDALIRHGLCEEAIRLCRLLEILMRGTVAPDALPIPRKSEVLGLLALMLLNHSRRNARVGSRGELIPLDEQDRSLWDPRNIAEGTALIEVAFQLRQVGPYLLQAAISAFHARAPVAAATDWAQIASLYEALVKVSDTAVIRLNHAVAVSMAESPAQGLRLLEPLAEELRAFAPFFLARADMSRRAGRLEEAREAYRRALDLTQNHVEREFIRGRIESLADPT